MNDVKNGEENLNLAFPIDNFNKFKEIAIVNFFQDNTTWIIQEEMELKLEPTSKLSYLKTIEKKKIPENTYTERELKSYIALENFNLDPMLEQPFVKKVSKIEDKREINFYLSQIDNTQNFVDNQPSDLLLKYYITEWGGFLKYQPKNPEYKPLKNGLINSISLQILDQDNQLFKNELGINILFHIR